MALEGTIKDFGLPDIFQLIGLQRKTGLLTLKSDKETVTVTFENGMVVMADSSAKRLEDRLGTVLVKQNKVSKDKLDEALQTQRATLQRLGHVLVAQNYITAKDLKDALQVQIGQIVFKVFRWREGEYHFAPTDSVDFDRENFTPMSADFILMEGIRMVDEWPIIEKKIPSMDIVFRSVVDASMIEVSSPEDGDAGAGNKIRLSPEEEKIYRKVDGTRTVQAIIDATGVGEFEVCRTLFDLLNRNIISTVGRGIARESFTGGRAEVPASLAPGYVMVAVVALLSLVGLVANLSAPFGVTGLAPLLRPTYQIVLEGVRLERLERLDRALLAFQLNHGTVPRTLDELVSEGLVDASYLRDPWSHPYRYALTQDGYLLHGVDENGRPVPGTLIERVLPPERP
jgi:hypothetical protein